MASKEKIVAAIGTLCEAFNRKPTPLTFKAYEIALADVSDASLDQAATSALRRPDKFMPTPGELRQLAISGGVSFEARADIAWNEFDRAVGRLGADRSVTFADGLINATVTLLGGWIQCCEKHGDDYFVWLQKQFKQTYVRLCNAPQVPDDLRRPLVGRLQMENSSFPDEMLAKLNAYTGEPLPVGTSQPVLLPPAEPAKRIERTAGSGPKRIGEVVKQITHIEASGEGL